ncbi:MAG: S46 family peptidase [Bacteroidales bacterium]|nr:S46 family peptidase [Bacteroidales bacterium]
MKRILALAAALTICVGAMADEGMWLLPLLQSMNIDIMQREGCRLTAEDIYSVNHGSLKDAVVQFDGGCTGEIVSRDGLLLTNHHCGYSRIQELSTPEHNYLMDGYWALKRNQEIPVPGLSVKFLVYMEDVTEKMSDPETRPLAQALIEGEAKEANPGCEVAVESFYDSNVFYLIVYRNYTDVRFVGAPPSSIGKFGGDTDNWEWPRHTGDFSMFRVYADKKGRPADYAPSNVPLKAKQHLTISLKGVKEGDYAMVMGYPGSTQRFQTAAQLKDMLQVQRIAIDARLTREALMWDAMCSDAAIMLQYADKYATSTNYRKKWQGEEKAFKDLNIIARQEAKEEAFIAWVNEDPARIEKYGEAMDRIAAATVAASPVQKAFNLVYESAFQIEIQALAFSFINNVLGGAQENEGNINQAVLDALDKLKKEYDSYYAPLDRQEAVALLGFLQERMDTSLVMMDGIMPEGEHFVDLDIDKYVTWLFNTSAFVSYEKVKEAWSGIQTQEELQEAMQDPAMQLSFNVFSNAYGLYLKTKQLEEAMEPYRSAYTAGLLEWQEGQPSYPDANFTMRLTYGHVMPYSPKDGLFYDYFTTLRGVQEKEDPSNPEFIVPEALKPWYSATPKQFGNYADKDGTLHLCFITNNDITGGNSGSPVLDAYGRLIGLAFDGNWESMSSDVIFEPELQRCICVDIRYVLFCIDKLGGAKNLIREMDIVK